MNSKLDGLLSTIDPDITIETTYERANEVINTYTYTRAIVEDWSVFQTGMAEFHCHLEKQILKAKSIPADTDCLWHRCMMVLKKIYGKNGEKAAFEMARTGNEGGLYGVLRALAMQVAEDYAKSGISGRILTFWGALSVDEKFDVMDEYLEKYGHLFPSELTEGSAARLKANFVDVLENHPFLIKRLRSVGR